MKVFLSWSGERSKKMAHVLRTWIPDIIQAIEPWMSEHDIGKGGRGLREIADELSECHFGILCITADNQNSQWVNFEAGALSKQVDDALVVPLLLDLKVADLTGPMTQFQATESAVKEDVRKLILDMNSAQKGSSLAQERLSRTFDRLWPELDAELAQIRSSSPSSRGSSNRSNSDMLSEMLVLMRQQERRLVELEDAILYSGQRLDRVLNQDNRGNFALQNPVPSMTPQANPAGWQRGRGTGLEGMTLVELQQVASGLGIRGTARMRKSHVLQAIKERQKPSPTSSANSDGR